MALEPIGPLRWGIYCPMRGWLADECAGGTWSHDVEDAMWFNWTDELDAVEQIRDRFQANDIRLHARIADSARPVRLK